MDRVRYENSVACLAETGSVAKSITALNIPVHSLRIRRGRPSLAGLVRCSQWLKWEQPDILQTWLYHSDLLGLVAGKFARIPVIVWNLRASDLDMTRYSVLSALTIRTCARLARLPNAIVVNSEAGYHYHVRKGYHPRRWIVITNGIDTELFKPDLQARKEVRRELGLQADAVLIGMVGRFDPAKDHENFLIAAGKVAAGENSAHFVLVGEGVTDDNCFLKAMVKQSSLAERVHFLGPRTDIPRLTAAMDIAACSSSSEGFPNIVLEAMACGVMCVVTDVGDCAKIVADTGIVAPPKNAEAFAASLRRSIVMGATLRRQLGIAARERVRDRYSLQSVVEQYQNLYVSLMEDSSCAA